MRTGALLLIGIGSALMIVTLLLVFLIPSGRRRRPSDFTPRRVTTPSGKISAGSPAGSLIILAAVADPASSGVSVGNRALPHGARLANTRQPQRAERAMYREQRRFPLRATTTAAADSTRDARTP